MSSWPPWLADRLTRPLPGSVAQRRFEPELAYGRHAGPAPATARQAAVIVLLYPHEGVWRLPLTLRPVELVEHGGQVSLPGGAIEPGESSDEAALRELQEELGVDPGDVTLLGRLTDLYVFTSNYQVTTFVGAVGQRPTFVPQPSEVAELLEPSLAELADPRQHVGFTRRHRGVELLAPAMQHGPHRVWGATCMILGELVALWDDWQVHSEAR